MKQNSTLQTKLKAYAAVAGAVAATSAANAQIVYTDVVPDTTVNTVNGIYQLDLNNDGTTDFALSYQQIPITFGTTGGGTAQYTYNIVVAQPGNPTANQIDTAATRSAANPGFPQADAHAAGAVIGPANLWFSGYGTGNTHFLAAASTTDPTTYNWGSWTAAIDQYVAMKFDISGQTHYGWVRLDVAHDANSFTVKDYAYDTIPNAPINAGQLSSIPVQHMLNGVKIFAFDNKVNVNLGNQTNANITITDMTGRAITSAVLASGNEQYDLSAQSAGIYMVTISTSEGTCTTKVSVQ